MASVGVIGGGVAGVAAALESASRGANVVLFEAEREPHEPRGAWPSILSGPAGPGVASRFEKLRGLGIEARFTARVTSVGGDRRVKTREGSRAFDSIVIAAGARPLAVHIPGSTRRGLHLLTSREAFSDLGAALDGYSMVALSGSGPTTLEVASRIRERGVGVRVFTPAGVLWSRLCPSIGARLAEAVAAAGVTVVASSPGRVAGVDRVEAVVAAGNVYPCEALVVLPSYRPLTVDAPVRLGKVGGIVVTAEMASSQNGVFAAGACTEVATGHSTIHYDSEPSAIVMGTAAGANACGGRVAPRIARCISRDVFGTCLVVAGLSPLEARTTGLEVGVCSASTEGGISCSLVYDKRTLRLWGVQLIGKGAGTYEQAASLMTLGTLGIDELAYQEFPISNGPSPFVLAAGAAMGGRF
jgi:3-phenylpropionate/trans-cinnamate dioxygenase ferredoxin reductase subunit